MEKSVDTLGVYTEKPIWQTISVLSLGLLGSIAAELILTGSSTAIINVPGLNNQMIGRAVTALTSFFVMLPGTQRFRQLNQSVAMLLLLSELILSTTLILLTTNLIMFLFGRFLLGIVVGSFLVMAVETVKMMGSEKLIAKSFSILFLRFFLVFGVVVVLGPIFGEVLGLKALGLLICLSMILSIFFQLIGNTPFRLQYSNNGPILTNLWAKRANRVATLILVLLFGSQFAFMMYLESFIKVVAGAQNSISSVFLLTFVIFTFLGAWLEPVIFRNNPYSKLIILPAILACLLLGLIVNDHYTWLTFIIIIFLGLLNGPFAIGWARWLTQNFSSSGSSFLFSVMQLSIVFGSMIGGIISGFGGVKAVLAFSGFLLLAVPICIMVFCSSPNLSKTNIKHLDED